ncbi:hypothetical protein HZZ00_32660 [Streptomyces sp. NEAU-sy36]|uniref:hypothetical protein n=1 Tax=unclassified Streptomyces TaxID=2593676 RepID=UPI0015D61408|nr:MULTISPECIES: hypothetical protein [unclassified Streptomyces]QLJ05307.1 hypothetical protein HZZ00_32660 [Streptomyces sp. NEAU-sy36]
MSLVELIARADERGLAAAGLACLDRCLPLLGEDDEPLRPLWGSLADGSDWSGHLERARDVCGTGGEAGVSGASGAEAVRLARHMLDAAPAERTVEALRPWTDACSLASLRIHRLLDPAADAAPDDAAPTAARAGGAEEPSPLVAAELRRQIAVLELLAGHGGHGLRHALELSGEGRRVLRAVVSRRARGTAGTVG